MKRKNNLYDKIAHPVNLILADRKARKGKAKQRGVREWKKATGCNILALHNALMDKTYSTSAYTTFTVYEPKERLVYRLPYIDRVVQHAVMNYLEQIFTACFTANSYSCIKGKGIHACANDLKTALQDVPNTTYCLKFDITKFYPSVKHDILKRQLRRKFKDADLLKLLDNVIDSAPGLPIGNYLSQYFANFYLTGFDHWLKEIKGVKHYFRYADDIVILHSSKAYLHALLADIRQYLTEHLQLTIKHTYQIFPVADSAYSNYGRGIDFVGYVFYRLHTWLRKLIKQNMARKRNIPVSAASYYGWAVHCNSRHLLKKLNIYATIQRLKHQGRNKGNGRRQDRHQESVKYAYHRSRVQLRPGQIRHRTAGLTNRI